MAAFEEPRRKVASFFVLVAAYLTLNTCLNLLSKWSLGMYGFRFPFLLTSCHMGFSFLLLSPFALRESLESHAATLRQQWKGVVYIGVFMALNIGLNNLSLLEISLTLNQVIRSAIPVVTCLLAVVVENHFPSVREASNLVVLTLGVMLAVWQGKLAGSRASIALCVAGTVSNGAMMTFSGKLLKEKLDIVRLTFYTAPISLACLLPFFWRFERASFVDFYAAHRLDVFGIIVVTSVVALTYNLVHVAMIKRTTAVTTTVVGEIKIVGLLLLSAFLLGEKKLLNPRMLLGCALAMVGFCLYSQTKIQAMRQTVSVVKDTEAAAAPSGPSPAPSPGLTSPDRIQGVAAPSPQAAVYSAHALAGHGAVSHLAHGARAPALRVISLDRRETNA